MFPIIPEKNKSSMVEGTREERGERRRRSRGNLVLSLPSFSRWDSSCVNASSCSLLTPLSLEITAGCPKMFQVFSIFLNIEALKHYSQHLIDFIHYLLLTVASILRHPAVISKDRGVLKDDK